jgi:hypothetical protein
MDSPPVSYSVRRNDFDPEIGRRLRIFCDGVLLNDVVEYDCDAGTVLRNKLGEDGQPVLNAKRDAIIRETMRGVVTVEWGA